GSRSFDLADREAFTRSDQPLCTRSTMLSTTNISRSTTCLAFVFPMVLLASACVADDADLEDTTLGDTSSVGDTGSSGSTSPSGCGNTASASASDSSNTGSASAPSSGDTDGTSLGESSSDTESGTIADMTAPHVVSTSPSGDATGESIHAVLS